MARIGGTIWRLYEADRVKRIRRDTAGETDDRAARYLIDELEKACTRDPTGDSLGTRYDNLMEALEAVSDRLNLEWKPKYPSLRSWGKAHDVDELSGWQVRRVARVQFETLLDALDDPSGITLIHSVAEPSDGNQWDIVEQEALALREGFAVATSATEYGNIARQCRELFVSLAAAAYDEDRHGPVAKNGGSVKKRIEAVIRVTLQGAAGKELRDVAIKALDLANTLQHRKTTTRAEAAVVADITLVTVNIIRQLA